MALPIRQGSTHKIVIGPVVAVGDGFVPITNLAISSADEAEAILFDNGTVIDISAYTFAAIAVADGYYHLTLQTAISNTIGHLTIVINDDSLCLPVKADFIVLDTGIYDTLYGDTAGELATEAKQDIIDTNVDTLVTQIGTAGAGLIDLGGMSVGMQGEVNAEADTALSDFFTSAATLVNLVWDEAMVASTGAPAITGSMRSFMEWWATLSRNVINQTATLTTVRNDADDGDISTSTVSDDATTFVRGEFST